MFKVLSALVAGAMSIVPAQAAVRIVLNKSNTALPSYTTAAIVQAFTTNNANGAALQVNTTLTPGALKITEVVKDSGGEKKVRVFTTDTPALAGLADDYLSVGNGSDYTISFLKTPVAFFSFAFNNIRSVNHLTLNFANGSQQILNGIAMLGSPTVVPTYGRVSYDVGKGSKITSVDFSGGNAAFLIDSIAAAAPEPATWLMMLFGFGIVGGQLRRRKIRNTFAPA